MLFTTMFLERGGGVVEYKRPGKYEFLEHILAGSNAIWHKQTMPEWGQERQGLSQQV